MQDIIFGTLEDGDYTERNKTQNVVRSAVRYMMLSLETKDSSHVANNSLISQLAVAVIMEAICLLEDFKSLGFEMTWIVDYESWHEESSNLRKQVEISVDLQNITMYSIIEGGNNFDSCAVDLFFNKSNALDIMKEIKSVNRLLDVVNNLRLRFDSEEQILNETCFELLRSMSKLPFPNSTASRLLSARTAIVLLESLRQKRVRPGFKTVNIQCGGTISKISS